jgi:peptidyl-prolyl cis-trans isomerase B (cyclophilin B)
MIMLRSTLLIAIVVISLSSKAQTQYPIVVMETSMGTLKIQLYDNTFRHSDNFVKLVNEGYYNGQLFHRVINNFMIQTGDDKSINAASGIMLGTGGKQYTISAEFFPEYYHKKGAIAAARQSDNVNPEKKSSGSQFYIVKGQIFNSEMFTAMEQKGMHPPFTQEQKVIYSTLGGTPHLDYNYTVFGEVIDGLEIIDLISEVTTDKMNRPLKDVKIIKMYTVKQ